MSWLFQILRKEEPNLIRPPLDCQSCQVPSGYSRSNEYKPETKCCLFKPYWSSLAMGYWAEKNDLRELLQKRSRNLELLPIGALHRLDLRQDYSHYRRDKSLSIEPCAFLNQDSGRCDIWQARPATCQTFYCSFYESHHQQVNQDYETLSLGLESIWVESWYLERVGTEEDWRKIIDYFDENPNQPLSEHLFLPNIDEAVDLYKDCYKWVKTQQGCQASNPATESS